MSNLIVLVPKYFRLGQGFSRLEQRQAMVHGGRRADGTQSAATWITSLVDTRKLVIVCASCKPKFDRDRHHYRYRRFYSADPTARSDGTLVSGQCDDCRQRMIGGAAYVAEESYALVCTEPAEARRLARWKARASLTFQTLFTRWLAGQSRALPSRKD